MDDIMKKFILISSIILIILIVTFFLNKEISENNSYPAPINDTWSEERQANLCDSDSNCELRTVYNCCAKREVRWCVHVNDILKSEENCAPDMICPLYIYPDDSSCKCSQNKICRPSE